MIVCNKLDIVRNFHNLRKSICVKVQGEDTGSVQGYLFISPGIPARNQVRRCSKWHPDWKGRSKILKLFIRTHDITFYI